MLRYELACSGAGREGTRNIFICIAWRSRSVGSGDFCVWPTHHLELKDARNTVAYACCDAQNLSRQLRRNGGVPTYTKDAGSIGQIRRTSNLPVVQCSWPSHHKRLSQVWSYHDCHESWDWKIDEMVLYAIHTAGQIRVKSEDERIIRKVPHINSQRIAECEKRRRISWMTLGCTISSSRWMHSQRK